MFRKYPLILLLVALMQPVFAQYVIYQQDFEDTAFHFKHYVLENIDHGVPASAQWQALSDSAWVIRHLDAFSTRAAVATSNYTPAEAADDWFVTPAIQLAKASKLHWESVSLTPGKPDSYQVYISNSNQSANGCLINPAVFSLQAEQSSSFAQHSLDLASLGYANQPIYVGFRLHTQSGGDLLAIDNIRVTDDSIQANVTLNFIVDVSAYDSLISADTGFVDIVGNFNDWDGAHYHMVKSESDSNLYKLSIPGFYDGQQLEFKFRINGSWHHDTIEFPYGAANRIWLVENGKYTYNALYNKQGEVYGVPERQNLLEHVRIFPNPVHDILHLSGIKDFSSISIMNTTGQEILLFRPGGSEHAAWSLGSLPSGIYFLVFRINEHPAGILKVVVR